MSILIIDLHNNLFKKNINTKNYCINFTTKKAVMVTLAKYKKGENKMSKWNKQLKLVVLKHDL